MPHAIPSVAPGLQALILCGPGVSLNTFTSNPEELPKALIPIANRPMVWYALDYCYRMGITSTSLILVVLISILKLYCNITIPRSLIST